MDPFDDQQLDQSAPAVLKRRIAFGLVLVAVVAAFIVNIDKLLSL